MVNRPRDFRHHDIVRAIRAARAAGIDPSVRVRTPDGVEYFFGGEVKSGGKTATAVRDPSSVSKGSSPGSQKAPLAEGGSSHGMVKRRQAADTAPSGRTSKPKAAASPKQASVGGVAFPAKPA